MPEERRAGAANLEDRKRSYRAAADRVLLVASGTQVQNAQAVTRSLDDVNPRNFDGERLRGADFGDVIDAGIKLFTFSVTGREELVCDSGGWRRKRI
jgi:hypothetical protein